MRTAVYTLVNEHNEIYTDQKGYKLLWYDRSKARMFLESPGISPQWKVKKAYVDGTNLPLFSKEQPIHVKLGWGN